MAVKQSFLGIDQEEIDVSLANPMPVTDFLFQVQLGNVEGFELVSISGQSDDVDETFEDLTPTGGTQEFPTSAETWEIVSTDANDTSAGTGARTVAILSLDANYVEQTTPVTLDGLTPVTISNTHLRSRSALVLTAGSDVSNTNIGDLIIQVQGGGTERMKIPVGIGDCKSFLFTIPANKTGFGQNIIFSCSKNRDCTFRSKVTGFGGATIIGGEFGVFQAAYTLPIIAPFTLPEKTDIKLEAKSTNPNSTALIFIDFLLVDNAQIQNVPTSIRNLL